MSQSAKLGEYFQSMSCELRNNSAEEMALWSGVSYTLRKETQKYTCIEVQIYLYQDMKRNTWLFKRAFITIFGLI